MSNTVGQRVGQGEQVTAWPDRLGPARWAPKAEAPLVFHPGRMVELSSAGAGAALTMAVLGVREAQVQDEPTAWVGAQGEAFFALDVEATGVDLSALAWVEAGQPTEVASALTHLTRSGAFGCVVVDLSAWDSARDPLPAPLLARLEGMCRAHDCCVLCVTARSAELPAIGPLVSLRLHARLAEHGGEAVVEMETLRDKRGGALVTRRLRLLAPEGARGRRS